MVTRLCKYHINVDEVYFLITMTKELDTPSFTGSTYKCDILI